MFMLDVCCAARCGRVVRCYFAVLCAGLDTDERRGHAFGRRVVEEEVDLDEA